MKNALFSLAFFLFTSGAACAQQLVTSTDSTSGTVSVPPPERKVTLDSRPDDPTELKARARIRHEQALQWRQQALRKKSWARKAELASRSNSAAVSRKHERSRNRH